MLTIEDAIQDFLRDIAVGQSPETVETYSQGMRRLREYLESVNHSPTDPVSILSVDHAVQCARWLSEEREVGKSTLRTYLSSISRFYAFLLRDRIVELSATDMERMREAYHQYRKGGGHPLPKLPPDEAVTALLAAARRIEPRPKKVRFELMRLRDIAIMEALRSAGMRVGELVKLRRDDLDYRAHTARVTGKGDKQRIVYFDDIAWQAIQGYLKLRADGAKGRALYQLPVFARHDRRAGAKVLPLTTDGVRLIFSQLARASEIDVHMTPHSMRHAFATKVLESTGDLAVVQEMLGHASPVTTRIYAKVSNKKIREAHRAAFGYGKSDSESENK